MPKPMNLKVAEAIQDDVNKGIVRIDSSIMQQIGVRPGDIVELKGEKPTVALVDRAYPGDIGLNIIRMDGITRRNAKTGIGEVVSVKKAEVKEAKKIIIAPARKGIQVRAPQNVFKQNLLGRAAMKGDIIAMGGTKRRRNTMAESPFFEDVFSMLDESLMGFGFGDLKFIVVDTNPKQGAVLITDLTEIELNPEAVEVKEEAVPEVSYEDIGGLEKEIKKIREMVELPLKHPEIFERLGIDAPKGVLLHGPPGTGKTLLAKAVANETQSNFILINGPEVMSKYYGQSEENLRRKFDDAEKNAPSIIFIDELDAIALKREETRGEVERRVVAQLLALMDGLKSRGKVVVIGATNMPNLLDPALRRPGRFDREINIGVPDKKGRFDILKIHTRFMPLESTSIYLDIIENKVKSNIKSKEDKCQIDLKRSNEEKKELEEKEHLAKDHILQDIINKIKRNKSKIDDVNNKIKEIKTLSENIKKNRKEFIKILKELKKFYEAKKRFSSDDPRNVIIENNKLDNKIKDLTNNLFDMEIITDDLKEECKRESILKELESIAEITHGFVGADLAALAKEAAMIVLRRILPDLKLQEEEAIPSEMLERLKITQKDFKEALKVVRPSAMREVLVEVPNVRWADVGGLESVKQELKEAVEWPLKYPDAFTRVGIRPPRGILLYGAPGTGKTMLAKAVANESNANFILVKGPELLSMWVGESEKGVRKVFERARQVAPAIVFFDEIDSLAPRRGMHAGSHVTESVVNQILTEMDGLTEMEDIVVMAATNRPDMLDTALLRPGRFDRIVLAPIPDKKTRKKIFEIHTKDMPLKTVSLDKLAEKTEGYVGADIEAVCREAAMLALRKDIKAKEVGMKNFEEALKKVSPSVTKEIDKEYNELQDKFRSARAKEMSEEKPKYFG